MTEAEIKINLDLAIAAYKKSLEARNYNFNMGGSGRSVGRNSPEELLKQIEYWELQLKSKQGTPNTRFVTSQE